MTVESTGQPGAVVNPGQSLREARERAQLPLATAARQLNLSERSLTRLEEGDFAALPGHTFTRGYIRSYAKLLGLDPERLVLEFDRFSGTDAAGSRVHSLGRIEEPVRLSSIGLRVVSFVVLLALAGVAFVLWQDRAALPELGQLTGSLGKIEVDGADGTTQVHSFDEPEDLALLDNQSESPLPAVPAPVPSSEAEPAGDAPTEAEPMPATVNADAGAPADVPTSSSAQATAPQPPVEPAAPQTASAAPAVTEQASAPDTAAAPASADAAVPQPVASSSAGSTLELRFSAECWTQVTDASGKVLISELMPAGATRTVQGEAPLSVVLGYSRGVDVIFNGEPVEVAPHRRGETARFKLGQ